jgi:GPH family glycoside/pentoside/hexuronide:cation symporter
VRRLGQPRRGLRFALASTHCRTVAPFAAGVAGFNLAEQLVVVLLLFFYLPPAGRGLPAQLPTEPFWGPLTAFGAAMLLGRIVDSLADPWIGHRSDRSRSRLGRRRVFLLASFVPLGALPAAMFFPPAAAGSPANALFLALLVSAFFGCFAAYVVPLLALLPELSKDPSDRARLSAIAGASGLLIGLGFPALAFAAIRWLQDGLGWTADAAVRCVALAGSLTALALCAAPAAGLSAPESAASPSQLGWRRALGSLLGNRAFRIFIAGQLFLVLAVGLVAPLLPYLSVAILGRSEAFVAALAAALGSGAALGFAALPRAVAAFGPRRVLVAGAVLAAPSLALWSLLGPDELAVGLGSLVAIGACIAAFAAAPFLLLAQLIDADAAHCGSSRAALFVGVQGFALKWVRGLGGALLAWLFAVWGNGAANSGGIRGAQLLASACVLIAAACFAAYPENRVLGEARIRAVVPE